MAKLLPVLLLLLSIFLVVVPNFVYAQTESPDQFFQAIVERVIERGERNIEGVVNPYQIVEVQIENGDRQGEKITIEHGVKFTIDKSLLVQKGERVVLIQSVGIDGDDFFQIIDKYRLDKIYYLVGIFFLAIVLLSGFQGVGSILGMIFSLGVIIKFIVPEILAGNDPLTVSIIGSFIIMLFSIYLAHGLSRKTTIALVSTFLTLVFIGLISVFFVQFSRLTGLSSEEAYSLRLGLSTADINVKGLLLGGILIGALGVLDDITTGLSASVFELAAANPKYRFKELYKSGLIIGKEHIASLVNTLVLAYAGASLPIFLILILNPASYPLWAILNNEAIVEEVVRTLAGSFGLLLAVPLTTFLSAFYLAEINKKILIKS